MSTAIIITICILLLFAYLFDLSSSKTKIPSVILLLILGWCVKQGTIFFKIPSPNLSPILPILGTLGLILIVLEGSLELELNKSKFSIIRKSSLMAIIQLLLVSFGLAYAFYYFEGSTFKNGLINAIPLAIISSAIAIPSARNLNERNKDFITYESSLSDIFGVIFFNFISSNDNLNTEIFGFFLLQLLLMIFVSFLSTLGLAFLLSKIKHHIKFTPIILLVILIYSISKIYHLPSLIFILIFGLFIGNLDDLKRYKIITKLKPEILNIEVKKFKEITTEMTFMIRSLFFLLFGYLIETSEILNTDTLIWAVFITSGIFLIRTLFLKILKLPQSPLLFIAPRGLITILLFLSIPISQQLEIVNKSLILQVIILTALVMMFGLVKHKTEEQIQII
jgi:Kef-type K+ transport system membrane component KefB